MNKRNIDVPAARHLKLTTSAPTVIVAPTLAQLLAGKPRRVDIARFLAALKVFYEAKSLRPDLQSAVNVAVPIEVLEIVGELLAGAAAWSAAMNAAKAQVARDKDAELQAKANEIWRLTRWRSKLDVARRIAPGRENTVRHKITKPK